MFRFIVFTVLISNSRLAYGYIHHERFKVLPNLVKDVMKNEKIPSILWAKTCWPKIDEFNFIRDFPFSIQIVSNRNGQIDFPIDENINKQWFFIDMNCTSESNFLLTIDEKYFAHPYRWIIADANNGSIQSLPFLPDSNIIIANQDVDSKQYILKQGKIILHYISI